MYKVGIMGCGIVATFRHIPAILETEGIELGALFDPNPKKLEKVQNKYGIDPAICFTDIDEFMQQDFHIASITSPAPYHVENCEAACKYGKNVLCEKPLAMTEEEAQKMIDMVEKAGLKLYVGLVVRFFSGCAEDTRPYQGRGDRLCGDCSADL